MTTPVTKELYTQLRAAMMSRDDASSISILKRIIAADPGDEAARKQLSTLWLSAQLFRDGGYVSLPPSCTGEEALQLLHVAMQLRNDHGWGLGFPTACEETLSSKVCPPVCLAPAQIAAGKQPRNGSAHVKVEPGMQPPSPAELPSAPVPPAQFMPPEGTELPGVPGQPSMVEYTMIQSPAPRQQLANPLPMNAADTLPAGPPQSVGMPRHLPTAEGYFRSTPKPARPAVVKMTSEKSSGRHGLQVVLILIFLGLVGWLGWCYYQKSQETAVKAPPVSKKCSQPEKKVKPAEPTLKSNTEAKTPDKQQETPGGEFAAPTPGGDASNNGQKKTGGESAAPTPGGDASNNGQKKTGGESAAQTTGRGAASMNPPAVENAKRAAELHANDGNAFTLKCSDLEDVTVEAEIGDKDVTVTVTPTIRLVDVWSACPDLKKVMYLYIDEKEFTEEDKDKGIQLNKKTLKGLPIPDEVKQASEEVNDAQRKYEAAISVYKKEQELYKVHYGTKKKNERHELWEAVTRAKEKKKQKEKTLEEKRRTAKTKLEKEYKEKFSIVFTLGERVNFIQYLDYKIIYN